jgi:hypothetical protein
VKCDLSDQSATKWQEEWDHTTKGAITKTFFTKILDRLKLKINLTPNFTTIITGHGNIKTYLHKYKIIESPMSSCGEGEQTIDHIILDCELVERERHRPKPEVLRTEN